MTTKTSRISLPAWLAVSMTLLLVFATAPVLAEVDETYWYASGDPSVPDGQLWTTSYGECWQSAVPDGPDNLPPCFVPHPPLVLQLLFELDKYGLDDIRNPEELVKLDEYIAEVLETPRDEQLSIVGHTDKLGSWDHNMTLSENRAKTIRDYMVNKGITPAHIRSVTGVAWEGGNDFDAEGNEIDLGPLENNPRRRRTVVSELTPGS